jgi:hypothetical protein
MGEGLKRLERREHEREATPEDIRREIEVGFDQAKRRPAGR